MFETIENDVAICKLGLSQRHLDKFRGVACTPILQSGKRKHIDCFIEVVAVTCCRLFRKEKEAGTVQTVKFATS